MGILANENAISTGGYTINNSVRTRASASAYLTRTPASAGNRKTWTWSAWVKRGTLSTNQALFNAGTGTTDATWSGIWFDGGNALEIGGYVNTWRVTSQVFRDPSAWYHIVVAFDSTQATAGNRILVYVNGSQVTAFSTNVAPTQNTDYGINQAAVHNIDYQTTSVSLGYFDGYMTEVNFIDGTALTASSFGATDPITGVWAPAKYTGTYGTNGFYLKFSDIATTSGSNAGLGKDFSGNSNYWNTNNISVTAGYTYDAMTDSPTNASSNIGNFCVLSPIDKNSAVTIANGNLTGSSGTLNTGARASFMLPSGKWYYEVFVISTTSNDAMFGFANSTWPLDYLGSNSQGFGWTPAGNKYGESGTTVSGALTTYTTNDTLALAVDMDAKQLTAYKNGTAIYVWNFTGTNWFPAFSIQNTTNFAFNFGQQPFKYTPPSGFKAVNAFNLPDSTVKKGNIYMDATLYTGNGTTTGNTQVITNAGAFKPDFVWIKCRNNATPFHILNDSVRGANKILYSNSTDVENSVSNVFNSFNSNGFTVDYNSGFSQTVTNANGQTYVGWQWQAGQGTTSSNTSGSITSTVSVNTTAGFSIATYTAPSSGNWTVGHGLGVAPSMVIVKSRAAGGWIIYHASLGNTKWLEFTTAAAQTGASFPWNSVSPTSTTISFGNATSWGASANFVAYSFAEIAGFSKFGSYAANASADGPFVYCGFRPRFIMFKRTTSATNWYTVDTAIEAYNAGTTGLYPNTSAAESTEGALDILSNGFKCRASSGAFNFPSTETFIYMAFAENPFKNALAR